MGRKGLSEKTCFIITIRDGFRKSSLLKALIHFRWLLAAFHKTQVVYIWAREKSLPRMKSPHFTARKKPKCNPKPNHCLRFIESICRFRNKLQTLRSKPRLIKLTKRPSWFWREPNKWWSEGEDSFIGTFCYARGSITALLSPAIMQGYVRVTLKEKKCVKKILNEELY